MNRTQCLGIIIILTISCFIVGISAWITSTRLAGNEYLWGYDNVSVIRLVVGVNYTDINYPVIFYNGSHWFIFLKFHELESTKGK